MVVRQRGSAARPGDATAGRWAFTTGGRLGREAPASVSHPGRSVRRKTSSLERG